MRQPPDMHEVAGDWPEDYPNGGRYECYCARCDQRFYGHKRRWVCKLCASMSLAAPAVLPRPVGSSDPQGT